MDIITILKKNDFLRKYVKKWKIYIEYLYDARLFSRYYLGAAKTKRSSQYRILLLVHSLEKGMCMPDSRPFGFDKVQELMEILKTYDEDAHDDFEYEMGYAGLHSWCQFYEFHEWTSENAYIKVKQFLGKENGFYLNVGSQWVGKPHISAHESFENVISSRYSVRDFEDREISDADLNYALVCFAKAPSACNRQMCKIYQIKNQECKQFLDEIIMGVSGFNKKAVHYFVVTYDMTAFEYYGERNQGYLNAGLAAMNFVNGLHARGIGSCFLQWSNIHSEDKVVRKKLNLPESENIAVVIGAGYYLEKSLIPCSCRKDRKDLFKVIE